MEIEMEMKNINKYKNQLPSHKAKNKSLYPT